ncbi:MAG: hypothetical protein KatS3mg035_2259 [Bacteroidia bacterium]|nr:MAG: hypothetical protein KatS3mg035_2259 [Bacteroidia bacterium]
MRIILKKIFNKFINYSYYVIIISVFIFFIFIVFFIFLQNYSDNNICFDKKLNKIYKCHGYIRNLEIKTKNKSVYIKNIDINYGTREIFIFNYKKLRGYEIQIDEIFADSNKYFPNSTYFIRSWGGDAGDVIISFKTDSLGDPIKIFQDCNC